MVKALSLRVRQPQFFPVERYDIPEVSRVDGRAAAGGREESGSVDTEGVDLSQDFATEPWTAFVLPGVPQLGLVNMIGLNYTILVRRDEDHDFRRLFHWNDSQLLWRGR